MHLYNLVVSDDLQWSWRRPVTIKSTLFDFDCNSLSQV